jgi:hypothetical protein
MLAAQPAILLFTQQLMDYHVLLAQIWMLPAVNALKLQLVV